MDKSWHAIHFLLCGSVDAEPSPLGSAVLGGAEIGPDLGYGPARWLSTEQVRAIARELPDREELLGRYDAGELRVAEVYPQIWDEDDAEIKDYVGSNYDAMRAAFLEAAQGAKAMLLWLA